MDGYTLDYALTSQRVSLLASLPWWEAISRMLKADAKAMLKSTSDDAERHKSRANIVALWDILLAITPTEAEVERVSAERAERVERAERAGSCLLVVPRCQPVPWEH